MSKGTVDVILNDLKISTILLHFSKNEKGRFAVLKSVNYVQFKNHWTKETTISNYQFKMEKYLYDLGLYTMPL